MASRVDAQAIVDALRDRLDEATDYGREAGAPEAFRQALQQRQHAELGQFAAMGDLRAVMRAALDTPVQPMHTLPTTP